jgi:hypothetical protein
MGEDYDLEMLWKSLGHGRVVEDEPVDWMIGGPIKTYKCAECGQNSFDFNMWAITRNPTEPIHESWKCRVRHV